MALVGAKVPPLRAIPAPAVTRVNVLDAYRAVRDRPIPPELQQAVDAATPR
jgi:hypothetical protein